MTAFKALLVGNAHFPRDPHGLGVLNGPLNDVDALHDELSNADTGIFSCQRPLKDAPAQEILDTTEEFFSAADRGDCLLFYYSGHGRIDLSGDFYLCAHDTDSRTLASPRINNGALSKIVRQSPAKLTIIILDCCYANEFKGEVWAPRYFRGEGRFVLAATRRGSPLVPDARTSGDLSPFTKLLVEALRRDDLDADGDGFITAHEVAEYITDTAARNLNAPFALQQWTGTGIVPIARSGKRDTPTVPPDIEVPASSTVDRLWPELLPLPPGPAPTFHLSRTLVTNGQFRAFLDDPANAAWRPRTARWQGRHRDRDYLRTWKDAPELENHPVVNVGVEAARAYLDWAGSQMGWSLRLPHESEWLRSAQAGRTGNWHTGDAQAGLVNYRDTLGELTQVGEFHANPYGVCDLLGQVWEICVDDTGAPVLRGGAFNTPGSRLLERLVPENQCRADVGFRCAGDRGRR